MRSETQHVRRVIGLGTLLVVILSLISTLRATAGTPFSSPEPGNPRLQQQMCIRLEQPQVTPNSATISMEKAIEIANAHHPSAAKMATSISAQCLLYRDEHHTTKTIQGDLEADDPKIPVWIVTYEGVTILAWGGTKPEFTGSELNVEIDATTGEVIAEFSLR